MKIGTPKEVMKGEARVAMTPDSARQLQKLGYECIIESGAGDAAGYNDDTYKEAGVEVVKTAAALWKEADVVAKVRPPTDAELKKSREGQLLISFFYPAQNEKLMQVSKFYRDLRPGEGRLNNMNELSRSAGNLACYVRVCICCQ